MGDQVIVLHLMFLWGALAAHLALMWANARRSLEETTAARTTWRTGMLVADVVLLACLITSIGTGSSLGNFAEGPAHAAWAATVCLAVCYMAAIARIVMTHVRWSIRAALARRATD